MIRSRVFPHAAFAVLAALALPATRAAANPGHESSKAPSAVDVVAGIAGVSATVSSGAGGIEVEGHFRVHAAPAVAWSVLTNYDSIQNFVSSVQESRITERGDGYVLVEQVAVGKLLFFTRRLRTVLKVQEEPPGLIRFEDVLHKDFEHYRGEWRIEERDSATVVTYHVEARPLASMPEFVARGMFQRTVRQLLTELEKEIADRAALAERTPTERSRP
jgi:carbon monoxide dehydrogenase subunit G